MSAASPPSLLDWLTDRLGQPRQQRRLRYGLGLVLGGWGVYGIASHGAYHLPAYLLLAAAAALFGAGLSVRGGDESSTGSIAAGPSLAVEPASGLDPIPLVAAGAVPGEGPVPEALPLATGPSLGAASESARALLRRLRLPSALLLAVAGQIVLSYNPKAYAAGLVLYALALAVFAGALLYDRLLGPPVQPAPPALPPGERAVDSAAESLSAAAVPAQRVALRPAWVVVAALAGGYAFLAAGGNRFRADGVLAWILAVVAWLIAAWDGPIGLAALVARLRSRLVALAPPSGLTIRITRSALVLGLVLLVGAYFRFARLDAIPPEMTSDHVEKLLDVSDLLDGRHAIFFERNTGREPLQLYFAAAIIRWFSTGLTHLTLKITSAVAGFLMLPYLYLLAREVGDETLAVLATLLAGVSFWATAISRVGLRFPLAPLFVAPVLFHLLRGVRTSSGNHFLLAGLFLGVGLYGYSTFRVVPVLVAVAIAWFLVWPPPALSRRQLLAHAVLLFATTFVVFLPLYRYALSPDGIFWYRTASRLGSEEQPIAGSVVQIFLNNNWNALRMFNWRGDDVWVNTIPGVPVLDVITGALLLLGAAFLLLRLVLRRDRVAGLLLLAVPILMLPSTLSLAFPDENPSVVRSAGAIPIIFLIAAYPLWLLLRAMAPAWPAPLGRRYGRAAVAGLLAVAGLINYQMYFDRYPRQYLLAAQNASEIGAVVRGYVESVGSIDRVYMCLHPHWADTRAVGAYAGQVGWEQVLPADQFATLVGDPRPLLVVVNPRSDECHASLQQNFPNGQLSRYYSRRGPDKDFELFYVPGSQ